MQISYAGRMPETSPSEVPTAKFQPGVLEFAERAAIENMKIRGEQAVLLLKQSTTMLTVLLAGIGGAFLSLFYPGSWNEGLSSGQGLMAIALVIFARWQPIRCIYASLLFGAAGALGPALQSVGVTWGYYLFGAAPYVLTLGIMIATCSPTRSLRGAPAELGVTR